MAKTYSIQVLDTRGEVIFSTRGRTGALARGFAELREFRAACTAASGYLYTHAKGLQDCLKVEGVTITDDTGSDYVEDAQGDWVVAGIVARFDRIGVDGMRAEREAELAEYRAEDEAYRLAGELV